MYDRDNMRTMRELHQESNDKEKTRRLLHLAENLRAHELLALAEKAKIDLTRQDRVEYILGPVLDKPKVLITRKEFDEYSAEYYERIQKALNECLTQGGKKHTDIDLVILTGGSTDIIKIRELAARSFPQAKISDQNKFSSVCQGLAYDAQRRYK
ncbi:MAG: Hsp70 family protein [Treponema sp.]|nr:Hsp70 family protein [Treponema sp.]